MRIGHIEQLLKNGVSFVSNNSRVTAIKVEPGKAFPVHLHSQCDSIFYVVEGKGTLLVEGKELRVPKGGIGQITRNTLYAWRNDGSMPLILFAVHAPLPDLYLAGDRYVCNKCGAEVEVTKGGTGPIFCGSLEMELKRWTVSSRACIVPEAIACKVVSALSEGQLFRCRRCGLTVRVVAAGLCGEPLVCCALDMEPVTA